MWKTIKSILGYLGCICITIWVALYIDGTVGIILTLALACALLLSLILTFIVKNSLRFETSIDKTTVSKGDEIILRIDISKRLILPAPVIEITADCSPHLALKGDGLIKGSVAGNEINTISVPYSVKYSGKAEVRILSVMLSDFLGIFSLKIRLPQEKTILSLSVYPNIPDAAVQTDFLKTASRFSDNDDEEETNETAIGSTGMPGYDHRQYYPGDPIKKINWKLSSKRDIYMVRLDEKTTSAGQMFFYDCPADSESEEVLSIRDNVLEGALAMFTMLTREGREAVFYRFKDNLWLKTEIKSPEDIYRLQEDMADHCAASPKQVIPPDCISSGKTPICFTSATSKNPRSAAEIIQAVPETLLISADNASLNNMCTNFWTISPEFEFKKKTD